MNVQQSNLKFTNESSIITCENLINHCLLRYTEYHHSRFISPVNKSHSQLNSNPQSNWNEMQYASQSLSIQNQMLINVYVPKKLTHHHKINKIYNQPLITSCRRSAIVTIRSRMPCKCHEMPCNHQFERRYITPTVTYVENRTECGSIL